ncbi:A-kinase anchor protein 13 isoform X3 [Alosa sapidissima]|uniref:A-kinase anchor protein 13 isoform X3 n=1 Tax=Alosa sapidissima TaxID=34773 RepID=UPI001C08CB27|nr:A-kinase anchor protein 13 isoform X3 [Alosa sapidissima]
MKLSPQQAPLYGECVLTVQLCDDECGEEEEEVEFYLLFAGSTQRHLASTLRISQVTLQAICPAHDSSEVVQVTLCSARPGGSVDALAEECFQFVQDLAWDMAQFLVSRAGGGGSEGSQEGALLLDECQIPLQECEWLDSNLAQALRHLQLPHGWSVLDTKMGAHADDTQVDAPLSIDDRPHVSTGLGGGQPDTLLHFAARRGLRQVALFLLEQPGGREALGHPNQHGRTPAREAHKHGHTQLQELLSDQEELSSLSSLSDTRKSRERHVYPGGRGCLHHHPDLDTYTLTQSVCPGSPPPTLQREVQDFQRLIHRHRDGEGDVELQQQLEKLYPATGNRDDRAGKSRANGSSRRTPKRKRGKKGQHNNNNSSSSSSSNTETHRTADPSPGVPRTESTANHVSVAAASRGLCSNGERAREGTEEETRAGPDREPPSSPPAEAVEEHRGAAEVSRETERRPPQVSVSGASPAGQIEEAESEERTVRHAPPPQLAPDRRSPLLPPPAVVAAAAKEQPKQEERSEGGEESSTADFTMGQAQTQQPQEEQEEQEEPGGGETRDGGRGNKGTKVPLGHASEPQTSGALRTQEAEPDSAVADDDAMQPTPLTATAVGNGHQEDPSTWRIASRGAEDVRLGSHAERADGKWPEEKEMAEEERADLADAPEESTETQLVENWTDMGKEPTGAVEEGAEKAMEPGETAGQRTERLDAHTEDSGRTESDTHGRVSGSPSGQQETALTASLSEKPLLSTEPSPEMGSNSASQHAISNQGDTLSNDKSSHGLTDTHTDRSLKETLSSPVEEQLDLSVSLGPGMAPGPDHLPELDGTNRAPVSSQVCVSGQESPGNLGIAETSDGDVSSEGTNRITGTECAETTPTDRNADKEEQSNHSLEGEEQSNHSLEGEEQSNHSLEGEEQSNHSLDGEEQGCDWSVPAHLSGEVQELSYAAVVKRCLTSEQDEGKEEGEREEERKQQQQDNEEEKCTVPEEFPLSPVPSGEPGKHSEQDSSAGSESPTHTEPDAHTGAGAFTHTEQDTHASAGALTHTQPHTPGAERFTDSEPHTPAGAESDTHTELDDRVVTESHTAPETDQRAEEEVVVSAEEGELNRPEQATEIIARGTSPKAHAAQSQGTVPETLTAETEKKVPETHIVQSEGTVPQKYPSEGMGSMTDRTQSEGGHLGSQPGQSDEAPLEILPVQREGTESLAQPLQMDGGAAVLPHTQDGGTEAPREHTDLSLAPDADSGEEGSSEMLSTPLWEEDETAAESQVELRSPGKRMAEEGLGSSEDAEGHGSLEFGLTETRQGSQRTETLASCRHGQASSECALCVCDDGPVAPAEQPSPEGSRPTEGSSMEWVQVATETAVEGCSEDSESLDRSEKGIEDSKGESVCMEADTHTLAGGLHPNPPEEASGGTRGPAVEPCPVELTLSGDAHTEAPCLKASESSVEDTDANTSLNETKTYADTTVNETESHTHTSQTETERHTHTSQRETCTHTLVNDSEAHAHKSPSDTDTHTHLISNKMQTDTHTSQSDPQAHTQLNQCKSEPVADGADPDTEARVDTQADSSVDVDLVPDVVDEACPDDSSQDVTQESQDTHLSSHRELETHTLPQSGAHLETHTHLDRDTLPESGGHLETSSTLGADVGDRGLMNTLDGSEEPTSMMKTNEIHRQTEVFYAVDSCPKTDLQNSSKERSDVPMCPASERVSVGSDVPMDSLADGDTVPKVETVVPAVDRCSEVSSPTPSPDDPPSVPRRDPVDVLARASWSSTDSWQGTAGTVSSPVSTELEESERKDRVTEVPALSALLRPAIRPLSPFRRHSWGPGKAPAGEPSEPNAAQRNSTAVRSPGGGRATKTTGHRRSSSLEGLSAEQEDTGGALSPGVVTETGRSRDAVRADRGSSLVSLTEEEQESDMGECSSLDSQKSIGLLRALKRPPSHPLTKSRSLVAISPKDLDVMGRVRPKRRISFSFSISPLLPKSKTLFSIGSSSSDEEEAVSLASFSSVSGSLEYSISEEDPGPLRSDGEGRQGTKVSRTFSYLKSKMSKKGKEKDKEKERLRERERDAKEKEKGLVNGHLFSAIANAPSTLCQYCSKPLNTKEALICNNCSAHVHKGCRENLPVCAKVKMKSMTLPDSGPPSGVIMRNKTPAIAISRDRPKSTISIPDDQFGQMPANLPRKSTSSIMSFSGHNPLSKSMSISNITGPGLDDMPLRRSMSQSTDSLHKTSKVNESTESLTDEGTEMMDVQLMCEFEPDVRELEADSWSVTVDKKQLKHLKKDVVKRQDIIYELMQTEMHQVRTLRIMGEVYCKGLAGELKLDAAVLERLFPCLDELTELHGRLLGALLERRRQTPLLRDATATSNAAGGFLVHRIGDVLVSQFSGSSAERMKKVYGKFCSRHNEAVNFYKELHAKDKRFQAFIKKKMSSAIVRRLSIPECILLVTQRITKYPVLIQRILQHTKDGDEEQEEVSRSLRLVKEVVTAVDNRVHDYERKRRLKDVYGRTDSKSIMRMKSGQMFAREDLLRGRRLLHDGPLQLKTSAGRFKDVQALLLSDVFVFLQEKDQKFVFASLDQRSTVISLQKLIVREVANEEKALFLITAGIERPEMVEVYASSKDERNTWIQLIQNAMQSIEKDEDEGIPSESEEDKRLQENKAKEMRDLLHRKDEQILGLLEEKVKLFRELCDCAAPDDLIHALRCRMMFRATPSDVTKGEPIMKDALKEVETLQELVNRSVVGAVGHQMSSCQDPPGGSVGPVCLPRRAETFGGFDSHQMNISKNGEKDEGEDLRRTESDSVLKKGGNANLLLLLKRNSEQVLNSVIHLHDLLLALQAVVVQQDSFIENQRQALTQRSASFSSTSSVCSSFSSSSRPAATTTTVSAAVTPTSSGSSPGAVAEVAEQERALAEERRRWQGRCEERERTLAEREQQARRLEGEAAAGGQRLEQEQRMLREREEELEKDFRLLREREEEVHREREKLRDAQGRLEREREQLKQHTQEQLCRLQRTPSTTSEDSMKFQSSGSLDRFPVAGAGDLSCYSTSPATGSAAAKDLMSRVDSKKRKGKSLNPFSSSSSSSSSPTVSTPQPMPSRLLQLTKPKDKKEKKKKKGKGQSSSPTDASSTEATDASGEGPVFYC